MENIQKNLNALGALVISGVLLSAFGVELFLKEVPCPLCMLQRLCMVSAGIACLLNVKFGIKPAHYGLALLSSLAGGTVALRQISLHVCPGFPTFGMPVLGLSLYTWSFLVFVCVVLAAALLLFLYDPASKENEEGNLGGLGTLAFILLFLVTAANIFSTFGHCGFGPCVE